MPASLPTSVQLIGKSDPMQDLFKMIGRVCGTDCAVLLIGEKGTGKSLVARAIHQYSRNSQSPFRVLSGRQLRESNDEELLGIDDSHQADGTCYITDFIAMPDYVQHRLVSIRQNGEYKCVHAGTARRHALRFIVATEGDIKEAMESGSMPVDLFYDWNFLTLYVPPLRDRKEDIPLLANHFLEISAAELRVSRRDLSPEAMELLLSHDWPGNLTELKACMKKALESCRGNYIRAEHLPELKTGVNSEAMTMLEMFLSSRLSAYIENAPVHLKGNLFRLLLPEMEQSLFQHALKKSRGSMNRAALYLGVHRNTLNKKIQHLG
jgi:two-component system nitrogen regulation response regulator GlnG